MDTGEITGQEPAELPERRDEETTVALAKGKTAVVDERPVPDMKVLLG